MKNQVKLKTLKLFLTVESHPEKKKQLPNLLIFHDFTACDVCAAVHLIGKAVHEGLNIF